MVFDGGSLGNPGRGYGSYLLISPTGRKVHAALDFSEDGSIITNNQAEYLTLIEAFRHLHALLGERSSNVFVRVEGDSQLVLNQLSGRWKVKNEKLRELQATATGMMKGFREVELKWHPRARSVRVLGH
ncbi:MAG: ribonuclease HI family protein [Thermomicrobiales bacterium]